MKKLEASVGFWSTVMITGFTFLFLLSIIIFPIRAYHDLSSYTSGYGLPTIVAAIPSFLVALSHIPFLACLYFFAREDKKVFAVIGVLLGGAYALLASVNYFTQITFVFQSITSGRTGEIESFILDNPHSFIFALEALAYTFLFFACFFWAQLFVAGTLDRWIRGLLYASGCVGIIGSIGYMFASESVAVGITLAAIPYLVTMAILIVRFARLRKEIAA
ncbi:MAG: hypothetical protein AABZ02_12175 [Bacteroidota bacterium]